MAWPVKTNLTVYQGSTYEHQFQCTYNDEVYVLTGFSARLQVRETIDSDTTLYEATDADDLTIDGAAGTVTLTIHGDTSAAWDWTKGVYDLEIVTPTDVPYRIANGSVKVKPEVTR